MKKWYQSKTIWGIAIAFFGYILANSVGVPDLNIPENADYNTLSAAVKSVKESQGDLSATLGQLMSLFGTLIAIYGRIKAEGQLS